MPMICPNCKSAATLWASLRAGTPVYGDPERPVDGRATTLTTTPGPGLIVIAPETVEAEIEWLHALCDGSAAGCPCQHRGTPSERRPAATPVALITSPAVSA
jgi:hypothetical protein